MLGLTLLPLLGLAALFAGLTLLPLTGLTDLPVFLGLTLLTLVFAGLFSGLAFSTLFLTTPVGLAAAAAVTGAAGLGGAGLSCRGKGKCVSYASS